MTVTVHATVYQVRWFQRPKGKVSEGKQAHVGMEALKTNQLVHVLTIRI